MKLRVSYWAGYDVYLYHSRLSRDVHLRVNLYLVHMHEEALLFLQEFGEYAGSRHMARRGRIIREELLSPSVMGKNVRYEKWKERFDKMIVFGSADITKI